jgi:hypothetical protein
MEWVIALIVVMLMPLVLIFWWIPRCDAIGIRKAKDRTAREPAPINLAYAAAPSPSRARDAGLSRAQEKALG